MRAELIGEDPYLETEGGKKILFNKLLTDCLIFFFIALFFTSIIISIKKPFFSSIKVNPLHPLIQLTQLPLIAFKELIPSLLKLLNYLFLLPHN